MKALLLNDKVLKASIGISSLIPTLIPSATRAADCSDPDFATGTGAGITDGANCAKSDSNTDTLFGSTGIFHTIANVLIYLVGAIAVIMLIIGGLRYVISQGNKDSVNSAKDTILYAVIGIVVAILAYAIVNFVTGSLSPTGEGGGA